MDTGDTAWMLTSSALVLFMTPGLALFYGGMVRAKNALGMLLKNYVAMGVVTITWVVIGYTLAFGPDAGGGWIGKLDFWGLKDVSNVIPDGETAGAIHAVPVPDSVIMVFQMMFAIITPALITGAFAERIKFSSMLVFMALWSLCVYVPMAHWVWSPDGWLATLGVLDFAGGTVVHINAGVAGLVCALFLGKRKTIAPPHSLTMSMIGASLLWFGWFGFNAGSNLEANGYAVLAFANTLFATAVAAITWFFAEWIFKGKPSLLGIISGAIAGLVGITPACGFVGIQGALVIGLACGLVCFLAVAYLKKALGYDDALDAFGVHAVGGIIGALLTGVYVNPELGGVGVYENWFTMKVGYDMGFQVMAQAKAVLTAIVVSGGVAAITMTLLKFTIGIRVSEEAESEGLDVAEHGEKAYN